MNEINITQIPEFSVSEISKKLQKTLEDNFSDVKIKGEISGFKRHSSGHCYFSLKDNEAVINAILWKGQANKLNFTPADGIEVIAGGKITTFAGRSQYQIIVDDMRPAGVGALMAMLELLKKKLSAEGLFDAKYKKPLPFLPKVIAVITSPTGAVIRDILHRLKDRTFPHIYVFPVAVQGDLSARQVSYAVNYLNKLDSNSLVKRPDVIIIARGGGSVEDLWSFNEEIVVRSIAASRIPIISAVGHETDVTLCDFAADRRAPTPTAAAEMAVPVKEELLLQISRLGIRLKRGFGGYILYKRDIFTRLLAKIPHYPSLLAGKRQKLDWLYDKLEFSLKNIVLIHKEKFSRDSALFRKKLILDFYQNKHKELISKTQKLDFTFYNNIQKFSYKNQQSKNTLDNLTLRLEKSFEFFIQNHKKSIGINGKTLNNLSYKSTLLRGFAVVRNDANIISTALDARKNGVKTIEFHDDVFILKNN